MEFIEILNPLDIDPIFVPQPLKFTEGLTIKDYFPDKEEKLCFVNIDQEELSLDYVVKETDVIFFAVYFGNKTVAIIVAVIAIIILTFLTWGAAAGASGMLFAGGGAGLSIGGQIAFSVALMALSVSLNILMAPKPPDGEDKADERSVYLWGNQATTSKQMIPIPILLGTFVCHGNMICSRTVTSQTKTVFEPLAEVGYYQFGLCSNPITEMKEIYLNKIQCSEINNDEISLFFTEGVEDQTYLYALPPNINGSYTDHVFRFVIPPMIPNTPPSNSQLNDYEPLNPGICIETVKNQMMDQPSHVQLATVFENDDKIYGGIHESSRWLSDQSGEWNYHSPVDNHTSLPIEVDIYPLKYNEYMPVEVRERIDIGSLEDVTWYIKEYDESSGNPTGTEDQLPMNVGEEIILLYQANPGGLHQHNYLQVNEGVMFKGEIIGIIEDDLPQAPHDPSEDEASGGVVTPHEGYDEYDNHYYHRKGWKIRVYFGTDTTVVVPQECGIAYYKMEQVGGIRQEKVTDPHHVNPDDSNWHTWQSNINYADDIKVEFVAPQGMYYEYTRNPRGGKSQTSAFVTFEWVIEGHVKDDDEVYRTKKAYVTSERDTGIDFWPLIDDWHPRQVYGNSNTKYYPGSTNTYEAFNQPIFAIAANTTLAFTREASLLTLLQHPAIKPKDGYPLLDYQTLMENGKQTKRLRDGNYRIQLRIKNHGCADIQTASPIIFTNVPTKYDPKTEKDVPIYNISPATLASYGIVLPVEEQHHWNNVNDEFKGAETLAYAINFFKIREFDWTYTCSYPYTTVAGLCFQATEAYNGRLPNMSFIAKGKFLTYQGTGDITDPDNWDYQYSNNPGYICFNLLFDSYYGAGLGGSGSREEKGTTAFKDCFAQCLVKLNIESFIEFAQYCDEAEFIPGLPIFASDPSLEDYVLCVAPDPQDPLHEYDGKWLPKRFTCNAVIDATKSILDWLIKILGSYDATIVFQGLKIAILFDRQLKTFIPKQIFTSSNILKDNFTQSFINPSLLANVIQTTFFDETNMYEKTPVLYKPLGGFGLELSNKTSVNVFGYTEIHRVTHRLHQVLRKTDLLKSQIEFATATQGFTRSVGDPIGVMYEFIEWGVVDNSENLVQAAGRIINIEPAVSGTRKILLDRLIAFNDVPVDPNIMKNNVILLMSSTDDTLFGQFVISDSEERFGRTLLTVTDDPFLDQLELEDMYLIGRPMETYKEAVITKLSFQNNNVIKITATLYDDAIWERNTIITDLAGNIFTKELVGILDCKIYYNSEDNSNYLNWVPPLILTSANKLHPDDTNLHLSNPSIFDNIDPIDPSKYLEQIRAKYMISFVRYTVYRKKLNKVIMSNDTGFGAPWEFVARTENSNYTDLVELNNNTYLYKVTTTLKINGVDVDVPLSWNHQCYVDTPEHKDYLDKIKFIDYATPQNPETEAIDFTTIISSDLETQETWNNMFVLWVKIAGSDTQWIGNLGIKLMETAKKGAPYIVVNRIDGLPTDVSGKVFGLVVINDEEIIFVDGHEQLPNSYYRLYLRYYDDYFNDEASSVTAERRYYLGTTQEVLAPVKNAHLGFYPIKYFAVIEDNGIVSTPDSNYIKFESLYYHDYPSNIVKLVFPSSQEVLHELETIPFSKNYPINVGWKNLITYFVNAGKVDNPNSTKDYFFAELGRTPMFVNDLEIGLAWITRDGEPHNLYVAAIGECPEAPNLTTMKTIDSSQLYCTFPLTTPVPSGSTLWAAATHIQTKGEKTTSPWGFTSFPVLVSTDISNSGENNE